MNAELNATIETANLLLTISKVCYGLAILAMLVAVFLWFRLKIKDVIGDLTGYTARKAIEKMRMDSDPNTKKSVKRETVKVRNRTRGKVEPTLVDSQKLDTGLLDGPSLDDDDCAATDLLETAAVHKTATPVRDSIRKGKQVELLEEVMLIHTNEVIG